MDVIITTINPPNAATTSINNALRKINGTLWVIGDTPGPHAYDLSNVNFWSIQKQRKCEFLLAKILPERHYCRKNLGYLAAIAASHPDFILETDDDNIPYDAFFDTRIRTLKTDVVTGRKWINIYEYFSDEKIWPRGFPLEELNHDSSLNIRKQTVHAFIQQALADKNPDIDAVYRLTRKLPIDFNKRDPLALGKGVWCPFNSQATTFFREAFPLLYLPSYCSFRMTDIWRSFVAQRCLWEMNGNVLFTEAKVWQERNEHDLMKDFTDEIPGYLQNNALTDHLCSLHLEQGLQLSVVCNNLKKCYEVLCENGIVGQQEMQLVEAWVSDLRVLLA